MSILFNAIAVCASTAVPLNLLSVHPMHEDAQVEFDVKPGGISESITTVDDDLLGLGVRDGRGRI
jgi:hypothetical protein